MLKYRLNFIWVDNDFKAHSASVVYADLNEAVQHLKATSNDLNDMYYDKRIGTFRSTISTFEVYEG